MECVWNATINHEIYAWYIRFDHQCSTTLFELNSIVKATLVLLPVSASTPSQSNRIASKSLTALRDEEVDDDDDTPLLVMVVCVWVAGTKAATGATSMRRASAAFIASTLLFGI